MINQHRNATKKRFAAVRSTTSPLRRPNKRRRNFYRCWHTSHHDVCMCVCALVGARGRASKALTLSRTHTNTHTLAHTHRGGATGQEKKSCCAPHASRAAAARAKQARTRRQRPSHERRDQGRFTAGPESGRTSPAGRSWRSGWTRTRRGGRSPWSPRRRRRGSRAWRSRSPRRRRPGPR